MIPKTKPYVFALHSGSVVKNYVRGDLLPQLGVMCVAMIVSPVIVEDFTLISFTVETYSIDLLLV